MDIAKTVYDVLKDVGPTVCKYGKYQLKFRAFVRAFDEMKRKLQGRRDDIESTLRSQRRYGLMDKDEVTNWLKDVDEKITAADIDDLIKEGRCFCHICRAKQLDEKTRELEKLFGDGEPFTRANQSLVKDDPSIIVDFVGRVEEAKGRLQRRKDDVESTLQSQLQHGKTEKLEVRGWLENAKDAITEVEAQVNSSSTTLILEEKIRELNEVCEQGATFTLPNQILVRVDPSIIVDFVSRVEEAKRKLQSRTDDIETSLKSQLQNGKIEKLEVKDWLEKAKGVMNSVEAQVNSSSPAVILEEKIRELNEACEHGAKFTQPNQILVNDDPSIKGFAFSSVKLYGRDLVLAEVLECLKRDNVRSVAVWGMGGVGKTTMMKKVNDHFLGESKFKKIIWVTVSKEFNILNIQNEIVGQLKEEPFSEGRDATWRARVVSKMLLQGDYLLIFDDVWEECPFEEAGIPIDYSGGNNFKFAMTTRFREVAEAIDCEIIPLKPLSEDESLKLFLGNVGSAVVSGDGKIKRDLEPTLKLIVEECDGLPLALVTVARSMKGKSSLNLWQNALNELKRGDKKVFNTLKFSYDSLEDPNEQHCFLYAALYPEDDEIPKLVLIGNWIEEGYLAEKETRYAMICKGHAILKKLEDRCLLECVKDEEKVRMHDLLRAMALDLMSSKVLVKSGVGLTELPKEGKWNKDLEKISVMKNSITEIPSTMPSPKCSMLTTLRLSNNCLETIPDSFFEDMPGLKILDLSRNWSLGYLPDSISKLVNLTTLLLGLCEGLEELPSLSKLRNLTKLDLKRTGIKHLPEGLEMLWNLKYLDLGELFNLSGVEVEGERLVNEILPKCTELQYLAVDSRIQLKAGVIEKSMLWSGNLESFSGRFSSMKEWSDFVRSRRICLNEYDVLLTKRSWTSLSSRFSRRITCNKVDPCGEQFFLPPDVEDLGINCCKKVQSLSDIPGFQDATDLRFLQLESCERMETLSSLSCLRLNPLQHLQDLSLCDLSNLIGLFEVGELPPGTFSSLKCLTIQHCRKISKLGLSRLLYLQNLEKIDVYRCDSIEEIMGSEPEEEEERKVISKLFLPKLKTLKLDYLKQLRSICSPYTVLVCDSIKSLHIESCPNLICENVQGVFGAGFNPFQSLEYLRIDDMKNLRSVFDEGALPFSLSSNFFPLTELCIFGCHNLNKLFTPSLLLENLQNLEQIELENCEQLEEIISSSSEEEEEKSLQLTLPKLRKLSLHKLPSLKSICSSSSVLLSNSLSELEIRECPNLICENVQGVFGAGFNPFQSLESLRIKDMKNLRSVFDEGALPFSLTSNFFPLTELCISDCHNLNKLFTPSLLLENLQNLGSIELENCERLEEIISSPSEEEEEKSLQLALPKLRWLSLKNLPSFKSICSSSSVLICNSLSELEIRECPNLICENVQGVFGAGFNPFQSLESLRIKDMKNLRSVFDEGALPFSPTSNFFPLRKLCISDCHNLNKLFTPSLLRENLQNLERIELGNCERLEEIISSPSEEEEEKSLQLALPTLIWLSLKNLPSFKSICSSPSVLICNSLWKLEIRKCSELKRIPLYLPLLDNSQPSIPPSLKKIVICASVWESLEWEHPSAKDVLLPICRLY